MEQFVPIPAEYPIKGTASAQHGAAGTVQVSNGSFKNGGERVCDCSSKAPK